MQSDNTLKQKAMRIEAKINPIHLIGHLVILYEREKYFNRLDLPDTMGYLSVPINNMEHILCAILGTNRNDKGVERLFLDFQYGLTKPYEFLIQLSEQKNK